MSEAVTPEPPTSSTPAVAAAGVTKRFPGVLANDRVSFEAMRGEVHALLGENGAGKTTLCSILTGLLRPDEGQVLIDGRPSRFRSPREALAAGVFMVHQHLKLVESMTVAENVLLGWSEHHGFRFSPARARAEVAAVAERYGITVDPSARIWQLSLGERQRVEILKALYRGARILILDEPTTVLAPKETDQLFASMRELVAGGGTVIFISHKLPEVLAISDRVTVLRRGRTFGTVCVGDTDPAALAELMVGRQVSENRREASNEQHLQEEPVLEVEGVSAFGDLGLQALREVSLHVKRGEIVGVAGVAGNGQTELAEVIAGTRPYASGQVKVEGRVLRPGNTRWAIERGVAYVPEDRMATGVAPGLSIADNLVLKSYRTPRMSRGPFLRRNRAAAFSSEMIERYDIRAPGAQTVVRQLSGGNVQRVLLARELSSGPCLLVAASPTRGLDVGATQAVWRILLETSASGVGILLISEDLDEILALSDRVAVFYAGRVAGVVESSEAAREQIGRMMAGVAA